MRRVFTCQRLRDISHSKNDRGEGENSSSSSSKFGPSPGDPAEGSGPYGGPHVPVDDRLQKNPSQNTVYHELENDIYTPSQNTLSRPANSQTSNRPHRDHPEVPQHASRIDELHLPQGPSSAPAYSRLTYQPIENRSGLPLQDSRMDQHQPQQESGSGLTRSQTMPRPGVNRSSTAHRVPVLGDDQPRRVSWPGPSYQAYRPGQTHPGVPTDTPEVVESSSHSQAEYRPKGILVARREPVQTEPPLPISTMCAPTETRLPHENRCNLENSAPVGIFEVYREYSLHMNSVAHSDHPLDGRDESSTERSTTKEQPITDELPVKRESHPQRDQQRRQEHDLAKEHAPVRNDVRGKENASVQVGSLNSGPPKRKKQVHWEESQFTPEDPQVESSKTLQRRSQQDNEYLRSLGGKIERMGELMEHMGQRMGERMEHMEQRMERNEQSMSRFIGSFHSKESPRLEQEIVEQEVIEQEIIEQDRNRVFKSRRYGRAELSSALGLIADHLEGKGSFRMIAIGGIVNCLFLASRSTTKDINFFTTQLNRDQWNLLRQAISKAQKQLHINITDNWKIFALPDLLPVIARQAIHNNILMFEDRGFSLYAAPFDFQMFSKMNRWASDSEQSPALAYDLTDAAEYLHQWLNRSHWDAVSWEWWAITFDLYRTLPNHPDRVQMRIKLAIELNNEFKKKYGRDGIDGIPPFALGMGNSRPQVQSDLRHRL